MALELLNDPVKVQELVDGNADHMHELRTHLIPKLTHVIKGSYSTLTREDAIDIAHDTMAQIYKKRKMLQGRNRGEIIDYIFKAAFNRAKNFLNKASTRLETSFTDLEAGRDEDGAGDVDVDGLLPGAHTPDPVEAIHVKDTLKKLTQKERAILDLIDRAGLTSDEVAQMEGVPVDTIQKRHKRARDKFKKYF